MIMEPCSACEYRCACADIPFVIRLLLCDSPDLKQIQHTLVGSHEDQV
jgi:hypothetical protein